MKTPSIRIVTLAVLLAAVAFSSSGCVSTMMLTAGKTEEKIFNDESRPASRASVENRIGMPVKTRQLAALPSPEDFRELEKSFYDKRRTSGFGVVRVNYDRLSKIREGCPCDTNAVEAAAKKKREPGTFVYARYHYEGRINTSEWIYTNSLLAFGSWGLLEPVLIPAAAVNLATGRGRHNYIDVWYDDYGLVVAYTWALAPYESATF